MTQINDATLAQIRTANPANSTWVAANAGSGKTRVLTQRVARLLIQGSDPSRILCLTYTKAAAAEMQNRLFAQLGEWSMKSDAELKELLQELGETGDALKTSSLARTRTLFAAALETPGGLKIQTIHAFCDAVLRRFPLEAGLSPQFNVMNDREAELMRSAIVEEIAEQKPALLDEIGRRISSLSADDLLSDIISKRSKFNKQPTAEDFGLSGETSVQSLYNEVLNPSTIETINRLIPLLKNGSTEFKTADALRTAISQEDPSLAIKGLIDVFLYKSGQNKNSAKIDKMALKKTLADDDFLREEINEIAKIVEGIRGKFFSLNALRRSQCVFEFAKEFLVRLCNRKAMEAKLDFDDLIVKTSQLLSTSSMAQWVLYRLDGGIDHILVDEAQDTSPAQWRIIEQLAAEFTSGEGASALNRTLFVVGDTKQSIYSFQGAEPDAFDEMKGRFAQKIKESEAELYREELLYSFRSADPILRVVDQVLETEAQLYGTSFNKHLAFKQDLPGRVDLWPLIEKEDAPEELPWFEPLNKPSPSDPKLRLARQIAKEIRTLIDEGHPISVGGETRPIAESDILILVRGRASGLFQMIIKELKKEKLAIAGADRMKVGSELAVKDILSLLKFLVTPEDDLSLAETLRSPLFGLSEQDLFTLAHGRVGFLWEALRKNEDYKITVELLWDLLGKADFLRPYELLEEILTANHGRENLLARLGTEAEESIDALLEQALLYETIEAPTLPGFINWFDSSDIEIKRNLDSGNGQIRVMTIHGAKGLEAPMVILPDTIKLRERSQTDLVDHGNGLITWPDKSGQQSELEENAIQFAKDQQRREDTRLLYVALTRAESWLIVCGARSGTNRPAVDWHKAVSDAMEHVGAEALSLEDGKVGLTLRNAAWDEMVPSASETPEGEEVTIPDWLRQPAEKLERPSQPISPSTLPGAKSLGGGEVSDELAKEKGTLLHHLLEILPTHPIANRPHIATNICAGYSQLSEEVKTSICNDATRLIDDPNLAEIFDPHALVEVTLCSNSTDVVQPSFLGSIDRMIVTDNTIWIVDYKSNEIVPETADQIPEGILRQMAAYYHMAKGTYPDREIKLSILWTRSAQLMTVPHEIVIEMLQSPLHLDQSTARS